MLCLSCPSRLSKTCFDCSPGFLVEIPGSLQTVGCAVQDMSLDNSLDNLNGPFFPQNLRFERQGLDCSAEFAHLTEQGRSERAEMWCTEVLPEAADAFPDRRSADGESSNNRPFRKVSLGHLMACFACRISFGEDILSSLMRDWDRVMSLKQCLRKTF